MGVVKKVSKSRKHHLRGLPEETTTTTMKTKQESNTHTQPNKKEKSTATLKI